MLNSSVFVIYVCTSIVLLLGVLHSSIAGSSNPCDCSPVETNEVIAEWNKVRHKVTSRGQRFLFRSMVTEMEKQHPDSAGDLQKVLENYSPSRIVVKVELYLSLLKRPDLLRAQLRHDVHNSPDWAIKAATLIPRSGPAVNKALEKVVNVHSQSWRRCVGRLAKTVLETVATATLEAKCRIHSNTGQPTHNIEGEVHFSRKLTGGGLTTVSLNIRGFNSTEGTQHAFHIHKFGRTGNKCLDAGPHYNPENKDHGAPGDEERHVGDLGNVVVDARGRVVTVMKDRLLDLSGANSIVGKSVVVHAGIDDLGRGGFPDSKTTGHAGDRIGCCVIERV